MPHIFGAGTGRTEYLTAFIDKHDNGAFLAFFGESYVFVKRGENMDYGKVNR